MSGRDFDVIVLGAGCSGLYAARTLKALNNKLKVLVIEANDYVGGRVKTDETFAPLRLPLGAEFIHDEYEGHLLREYIANKNWELENSHWPNYYWISAENAFVHPSQRPEVIETMQRLSKITLDEIPQNSDISLLEWMKSKGFSQNQINSIVPLTNDWGGVLSRIGLRDMVEMYKKDHVSEEGETYAVIKGKLLSEVIFELAKEVNDIRLNWPVTKIVDRPSGQVSLFNHNGEELRCKRVIITVSVNVLKENVINFVPPLPKRKLDVLKKIEMTNLVKGHFIFREPFWKKQYPDVWDVCCVGPVLVPEVWMKSSKDGHFITCFIALDSTSEEGSYEEQQILQGMQEQLDRMFASAQEPHPATKYLIKRQLSDWRRNPYVRGGYVYPSIGVMSGDKDILAEPVGNIFFAGEATHEIIAAMKTGERAAEEVFASLSKGSKL